MPERERGVVVLFPQRLDLFCFQNNLEKNLKLLNYLPLNADTLALFLKDLA